MTPVAGAVQDSPVSPVASGVDPALGLGARLEMAGSILASVVADLDPARLDGSDATDLYGRFVDLERLVQRRQDPVRPPHRGVGGVA